MAEWRTKTIERMFCDYCHENGRIVKADAVVTKRFIKFELQKRLARAFHAMDECEKFEDGEVIFAKFINGRL